MPTQRVSPMNLVWLLVVILVLVYIISNYLRASVRNANDQMEAAARRARQKERTARVGSSDIDRFLEEVNRRRRQALERRSGPIEPETRPLRVPPPIRQRVATKPLRERPAVQVPRPRPVARRPLGPPTPATEPAVVMDVLPVVETPQPKWVPAPRTEQTQPPQVPIPAVAQEPPAPMLQQLSTLLSSEDNLRAAFVIQEVLGRPLCLRRLH
jgi:hypothetical protein